MRNGFLGYFRAAGRSSMFIELSKLTKFRIKLLAGDKVLVEISPYDLSRGG